MASLKPPSEGALRIRKATLWTLEDNILCLRYEPNVVLEGSEDFTELIEAIQKFPELQPPVSLLLLDHVPDIKKIRGHLTQKDILRFFGPAATYLESPKERYRAAFYQHVNPFPFINRIFTNLDDALAWLRHPQVAPLPPTPLTEVETDEFLNALIRFASGNYHVRLPEDLEPANPKTVTPLVNLLLEETSATYQELQQAYQQLEQMNAELSVKNEELQQLNQALQQTQDRLFDFAEASSDVFWETDAHHRFTWMQLRDPSLPGRDPLGRTRFEMKRSDDDEVKWQEHQKALSEHESFRDFEYQQPSGRWVRVSGKPFFNEQGHFMGYRGSTSDITERHRLEAQYQEALIAQEVEAVQREADYRLMQQSKLAALGELATSVAHEVNNPLTFLSSIFQLWKEDLDEEDRLPERSEFAKDLQDGLKQVRRISEIVDHLRNFGRQDATEETRLFSLREPLDGALLLVHKALKNRNIALHNQLPEDLPLLEGIPGQMEQVFLNLLNNAKDALSDWPHAEITLSAALQGDHLCLSVQDNGPGIPQALQGQIFNSFFTTKPSGKGTGLGLSIVRKIVEGHGGRITCSSQPGQGTTFTLMLPLPDAARATSP